MKGVPYDALQTILDGKGKWWDGMDPVDLYGPPHTMPRGPRRPENDPLLSPFANQFMWRVDDAITKYHPDVIYFDEHAGDSQVDLGVHMGLGFLAPQLAANFYNKSLQWNHGKMEAVLNLKGVGGRYNSFQNSPELLPFVDRSLVRGKCKCHLLYRNNGNVYAALMNWTNGPITLKALHSGGATLGKVSKVELLGSDVPLTFVQDDQGLTVTPGGAVQPLAGITHQPLATMCRVLRVTHDKGWFNDDDPGATYPGWIRRCNLGSGDFNNDLTISETPGDVWSCSFAGSSVSVIAPKEPGAGRIEVQIDGQSRATADESTTGPRLAEQVICEVTGLTSSKHIISIVNRGPGPVAVDALIIR